MVNCYERRKNKSLENVLKSICLSTTKVYRYDVSLKEKGVNDFVTTVIRPFIDVGKRDHNCPKLRVIIYVQVLLNKFTNLFRPRNRWRGRLQSHCCWAWGRSRQWRLQTISSRRSKFSSEDSEFWKVREIRDNLCHCRDGDDACDGLRDPVCDADEGKKVLQKNSIFRYLIVNQWKYVSCS